MHISSVYVEIHCISIRTGFAGYLGETNIDVLKRHKSDDASSKPAGGLGINGWTVSCHIYTHGSA